MQDVSLLASLQVTHPNLTAKQRNYLGSTVSLTEFVSTALVLSVKQLLGNKDDFRTDAFGLSSRKFLL